MRKLGTWIIVVCALAVSVAFAGDDAIEKVMKAGFKGKTSPVKKIIEGEGGEAEYKQLLEWTRTLASSKPPKGDAASWKEKTGALVNAAELLTNGKKSEGIAALKEAANCKACHKVHKED
ncbi:MAG: hypothetical protein GC159_04665 [Phycisphaera sp.]|nr:hypothetical protein [Phycisphaera sp.]